MKGKSLSFGEFMEHVDKTNRKLLKEETSMKYFVLCDDAEVMYNVDQSEGGNFVMKASERITPSFYGTDEAANYTCDAINENPEYWEWDGEPRKLHIVQVEMIVKKIA